MWIIAAISAGFAPLTEDDRACRGKDADDNLADYAIVYSANISSPFDGTSP